ncbi:DUF7601 domain-containing protein [Blautia sp. MSJ-19]|uniref:DUF7601 domain-containing protein n=1 Tax=Blautia sp. MSJ-19 TaxID=2841517 RepID=UPI001C0F2E0A|nr:DUF5979 domain-containing protein [Blautia sp. MSJ-19]MBU5479802.1 hypothetical protein [Blautia sp. MSJ-19]
MMRRSKTAKKVAAMMMAGAMMTALALPVMAADSTTGGEEAQVVQNVTLTKKLSKYAYAYAPDTAFQFQIVPGSASGDGEVYAGPAGGVTFADGKDSISFSPSANDIGKTTLTGTTTLSVNEDAFTAPGIYRYEVSEVTPTDKFDGVGYSKETKIFDVYKFSDGTFNYCFETKAWAKDDGIFTNTYEHGGAENINDLTIAKEVTGKIGNKSHGFQFKISVDPSDTGEKYYVAYSDGTVIAEEWDGSEKTFTLSNGQSAKIYGLSAGDTYTVTETEANADGYTTTIDGAATEDGTKSGSITADTNVNYTNDKDVPTPTGIAMDVAPYAIMVAVAFILGFGFLRVRHFGKNK